MRANDVRSTEPFRHGAYLCLSVPADARQAIAGSAVPALIERLGLRNEFEPGAGHPTEAIAFLRRVHATPADITDDELLGADAIVHVASPSVERVAEFSDELTRLLGPEVTPHALGGVVRPTNFTGNAMHNFSYAHQIVQQPGTLAPNAFLVPMSKTTRWWEKDWMERHTYFLPRYDDTGHMLNEGHALVAEAGIACLLRRTYKQIAEPAPAGTYDFINYFECAEEDIPTFQQVCAALRDVARNPEWQYVREGPTWHGRRVATWSELFE